MRQVQLKHEELKKQKIEGMPKKAEAPVVAKAVEPVEAN